MAVKKKTPKATVTNRTCIFCPSKKMTAEHLFADWISWSLQPKRKPRAYRLWHRNLTSAKAWHSTSIDYRAKILCNVCNNEFFSDLESDFVKPLVEPMMLRGQRTVLTLENRLTITAWVIKTMIVYNHMWDEGTELFYTQADRRRFRDTLEAPEGVQIWLARTVKHGPISGQLIGFDPSRRYEMRAVRYYVLTFALRHFAVQLLALQRIGPSAPSMKSLLETFQPGAFWSDAAVRIWPDPGHDVIWPPRLVLTPQAFKAFSRRWGGVSLDRPPT